MTTRNLGENKRKTQGRRRGCLAWEELSEAVALELWCSISSGPVEQSSISEILMHIPFPSTQSYYLTAVMAYLVPT